MTARPDDRRHPAVQAATPVMYAGLITRQTESPDRRAYTTDRIRFVSPHMHANHIADTLAASHKRGPCTSHQGCRRAAPVLSRSCAR